MPPPKNDSFTRLSSFSHLFNNSDSYEWEDILRQASVIPQSQSEVPKVKCYEDFKDVEGIMQWSRYVTYVICMHIVLAAVAAVHKL